MLRPYQRRLLFSYLANAARRLDRRDPAAADLTSWVADNAPVLDDEKPGEVVRRRRGRRERIADPGDPHLTDDGWIEFQEALADKARTAGRPKPDLLSRRLKRLAGITGIRDTVLAASERFGERTMSIDGNATMRISGARLLSGARSGGRARRALATCAARKRNPLDPQPRGEAAARAGGWRTRPARRERSW